MKPITPKSAEEIVEEIYRECWHAVYTHHNDAKAKKFIEDTTRSGLASFLMCAVEKAKPDYFTDGGSISQTMAQERMVAVEEFTAALKQIAEEI